ncbi:interferon-induced protein with tetratricopeptide repeats 5-like [Scyliorhinus canicula]|uniref:interferon-induced protein with tetratricopeptide repeats 5-like n=1 Tax=Scyliorhinus canicula TaxID=7830 RepID=UPI0018F3764C|nr:interferon-induced protein with tetratricopeptide repeats 5-like [Scyliorhinus canicula]
MSIIQKNLLKVKLNQLQCHFTWIPQKDNIDLDGMKQTLQDSVKFDEKYQATSYNQLAFVNCLQENCEEAIQNLKEAERILRDNHEDEFDKRIIVTYGNYAWVYFRMGKLTEAQSYLDKLERICQQFPGASGYTAMIPEVYGEKGWSLLSSAAKCYEEAVECFQRALEEDTDNVEWNFGFATALMRLEEHSGKPENGKFSELVMQLKRVLELDPGHTVAMVLLALKLQDLNENEKALRLVEQALQKTPDQLYMIRYAAKFYRRAGEVGKALELLEKGLKIIPNSAFFHHQIGLCYKIKLIQLIKSDSKSSRNFKLQRKVTLINQCKHHFDEAFRLKPSLIMAKLAFAEICTIDKDHDKAEAIYKNLLNLEYITLENKQEIYLEAGKFEFYHKKSELNASKCYLEGFKIKHASKARERCRYYLEKTAENRLCENRRDIQAFCIRGIIHMVDGQECFEKVLEIERSNEE